MPAATKVRAVTGLAIAHFQESSKLGYVAERLPRATPDFDGFAADHPWVGQKIGKVQPFPGGFAQQFQAATAYGVFGGDPMEVHGAIRDKYLKLNGPAGVLGFPTTNESATPDGKGRYNHFQNGSILLPSFCGRL
jgi:uncharacterized protein with LGFP repeats